MEINKVYIAIFVISFVIIGTSVYFLVKKGKDKEVGGNEDGGDAIFISILSGFFVSLIIVGSYYFYNNYAGNEDYVYLNEDFYD